MLGRASGGRHRAMPGRKLAAKASDLLKGLRPKQSILRNGKAYQIYRDEAEAVTTFVDSESEGSPKLPPLPQAKHSTRESASVLGKRRKNPWEIEAMPTETITIHEDAVEDADLSRGTRKMSAYERGLGGREGELFDHDSDGTDSDEELDESVLDDMRKLEESFSGISARYRLVNRIGEGVYPDGHGH